MPTNNLVSDQQLMVIHGLFNTTHMNRSSTPCSEALTLMWKKKENLRKELGETVTRIEEYLHHLLGHPINPRSPLQLKKLFYNDFKIKPVTAYNKATGGRGPTCNADALDTIAKREVLLAPVCAGINDVRSLGTFKSVASQELDVDNRIRCSYTVPGTETYRYNSREDAFGYGTNLQNVSAGDESHDPESHLYRPNLRKMFIPDPGYAIADHDLDQADARIVAWEADCPSLKEIFNDPDRDLHNENCEIIFWKLYGQKPTLTDSELNREFTQQIMAQPLVSSQPLLELLLAKLSDSLLDTLLNAPKFEIGTRALECSCKLNATLKISSATDDFISVELKIS